MITPFLRSLTFITAIFLVSGGLAYMMSLDGAEFRLIDQKFVQSTPLYLFSNIIGVFGFIMMYNTHTLYKAGDHQKATVKLMTATVLIVVSLVFTHILFMEGLRK